jgi:transglutaminase-like putative cysteine protease
VRRRFERMFHRLTCRLWILPAVAIALCLFAASATAQTDDEIRVLIAKAGTAADYPGADVVSVFDRMDVTVEESGLAHYRRHTLTKVLTEGGALAQAALRFDYDPASNLVEIRAIRVFRKGGAVDTVDPSTVRDLFQPASMIYWGARMKVAALPRLEVGDAVEVRTDKKGFEIAYLGEERGAGGPGTGGDVAAPVRGSDAGAASGVPAGGPAGAQETVASDESRYIPPMRGSFYDVVYFRDSYPFKEKRYDLHMPKDKPIQFQVYNGTLSSAQRFDDTTTHYSWWLSDIPALEEEPRSAETPDVATKLVLSTLASWQEKSRWFAAIHDTIYTDNDEIRALVRDLTAGLTTDVDKVEALQHWAAQEIRYSGLSMGKGEGYTHHPGKMSFRDRCGVCKDKAGMLITLMRTAGYDVWPALTMAGARVEQVPADQFNHSVVAWRHPDGSFTMLDPTWVPYSNELWSSAESEQNYVIGTPEGEGLMITPYSPPEKHVLSVVSRGSVDRDGNLTGTLHLEGTNYMDQRMRRWLGTHKRDDLRSFVEGWLASISPDVEVKRLAIGDPLDFKKRFALDVEYRVPRYAVAGGGTLDFPSPAWRLGFGKTPLLNAASAVDLETRELPLFIWNTQTYRCDESISVPPGMKLRGREATSAKTGEYASYEMSRSLAGAALANTGSVYVRHRTIPAGAYPEFRSTIDEAKEFATERVVLEREGGSR